LLRLRAGDAKHIPAGSVVMGGSRTLLGMVFVAVTVACSPLLGGSDVTFADPGKGSTGALHQGPVSGGSASQPDAGATLPAGVRFATRLAAPAPHIEFGTALAVAGHTVAVTAPFDSVTTQAGVQARAGATYLFDLSMSPPSFERIVAPNADAMDGDLPSSLLVGGFQQSDWDWAVMPVAMSDTTLVVGAPAEASARLEDPSDNSAPYAGAVYVYDRTRPGSAPQYLKAPNAEARDVFGLAVSLSTSWLAIGVPRESSSAEQDWSDNGAPQSGAVFVYHRSGEGTPFENPIYIKSPVIAAQAAFGTAVAITEDMLVIGAPGDSHGDADVGDRISSSLTASGTVYIYRRSGTEWVVEHSVKAKTAQDQSYFGLALSPIWSGAFAVGAPWASGCDGPNGHAGSPTAMGAAYLLHQEPGGWSDDCVESDASGAQLLFGFSVGVLDTRLVVGAPWDARGPMGNTADITPGSGSTYVYERAGYPLSGHYFKPPEPRWAGLGVSLSVAPGYLVVGAPVEYDPPRAKDAGLPTNDEPAPSGAVYVYSLDGG
jgi:hypothetical protein